jgi:hypothetical protein
MIGDQTRSAPPLPQPIAAEIGESAVFLAPLTPLAPPTPLPSRSLAPSPGWLAPRFSVPSFPVFLFSVLTALCSLLSVFLFPRSLAPSLPAFLFPRSLVSLVPCSLSPCRSVLSALCSLLSVFLFPCSLAPSLPAFLFPWSLGPCFSPTPPYERTPPPHTNSDPPPMPFCETVKL